MGLVYLPSQEFEDIHTEVTRKLIYLDTRADRISNSLKTQRQTVDKLPKTLILSQTTARHRLVKEIDTYHETQNRMTYACMAAFAGFMDATIDPDEFHAQMAPYQEVLTEVDSLSKSRKFSTSNKPSRAIVLCRTAGVMPRNPGPNLSDIRYKTRLADSGPATKNQHYASNTEVLKLFSEMISTKDSTEKANYEAEMARVTTFFKRQLLNEMIGGIQRNLEDNRRKELANTPWMKRQSNEEIRESVKKGVIFNQYADSVRELLIPEFDKYAGMSSRSFPYVDSSKLSSKELRQAPIKSQTWAHLLLTENLRAYTALLSYFTITAPFRIVELCYRYCRNLPNSEIMERLYNPHMVENIMRAVNLFPKDPETSFANKEESTMTQAACAVTAMACMTTISPASLQLFTRSRSVRERLPSVPPLLKRSINNPEYTVVVTTLEFAAGQVDYVNGEDVWSFSPKQMVKTCKRKITKWNITNENILGLDIQDMPQLIERAYKIPKGSILSVRITDYFQLKIEEWLKPRMDAEKKKTGKVKEVSVISLQTTSPLESLTGIPLSITHMDVRYGFC